MLANIKHALDKGLYAGILLTDLSKAFDSLSHDLLIDKLYAYGFSKNALKLILDYLSENKEQKFMNLLAHGEILFMVSHKDLY